MGWFIVVVWAVCWTELAAVKVKVVMHSDEDSRVEEEERFPREHKPKSAEVTLLPFLKKPLVKHEDEEKSTTVKPRQMHPNEMIFPLIYKQTHINSMFKFGENWYTWSTEKRTDGSKAINYYICYDEPKHCDEVGWERTESLPKCAFQIDSLMPDDRACINPFGVEPHNAGACDGAEQMKVSEMVRACGPRIRSLWRFFRVGRRPAGAVKPADVNSLICEDEEECYITIEYRIHHDRITFSLHEPSRGQTFKSALKREVVEEESKTTERPHTTHRTRTRDDEIRTPKFRVRQRKPTEGKGILKEHNDSGYGNRRLLKNKIKIREDVSEDLSE
ncbi:unnamed protein product [Diatraea saccharalis]|uniref:Uncharacterized protein n=1 Tax=Diatraea saccharalis TaxID=40085 RepID=A0A9N9N403_9NEOP|nr:unnamed protein product [Diatraea saccharalis]